MVPVLINWNFFLQIYKYIMHDILAQFM